MEWVFSIPAKQGSHELNFAIDFGYVGLGFRWNIGRLFEVNLLCFAFTYFRYHDWRNTEEINMGIEQIEKLRKIAPEAKLGREGR